MALVKVCDRKPSSVVASEPATKIGLRTGALASEGVAWPETPHPGPFALDATVGLRSRPANSSGHDPAMHSDLTSLLEPLLLEHSQRPAAKERTRDFAAADVLGVRFDDSTTYLSDRSKSLLQGDGRNSVSSPVAVDEEARNAPVGKLSQPFFVRFLAPDVRKLRRGTILAPPDDFGTIEDERGMRPPLLNTSELHGPVGRGTALSLSRLEMERDAPTPTVDPIVLLHEASEGRPCGGR